MHTIDPGFVNRRLVETVIGPKGMAFVDEDIRKLPSLPDGLYEARIDHVYTNVLLIFCEARRIKTLGELLATADGNIFCSTERASGLAAMFMRLSEQQASSFLRVTLSLR